MSLPDFYQKTVYISIHQHVVFEFLVGFNFICSRGDHIVPNMNDAFPHLKKKPEVSESLCLLRNKRKVNGNSDAEPSFIRMQLET